MNSRWLAAAFSAAAVMTAGTAGAAQAQSEEPADASASSISVDFEYVTRLRRPGAPDLVKRQSAAPLVPTPLDVDGDLLPDVVGTLQALNTKQFTLSFHRSLGSIGTLPISAEAVISDPTGALPRANIGFGYDARDSSAPTSWESTAVLTDPAAIDVTTTTSGAGASIATIAGLFDGDAETRTSPMAGSIRYAPVPATSKLGVTVGSEVEVRAGATTATDATAEAQIVEGTRKRVLRAAIGDLPQSLSLHYSEPAVDQRTVSYSASSRVPSLSASYADTSGSTLKAKALVNATSLPLGMTLSQQSARKAAFTTTGGALGSLEAGFANGEPALLATASPYVRVRQAGTLKSVAARVDDLSAASFDATTDVTAELQLGAGARKPFRALVETPGRTVDGTVSNLPRHLKALYSAAQGKVTYDAFGEAIDHVGVTLNSTTAMFGRVKRLVAGIDKLPPAVAIGFKPASGRGLAFSAAPAVGAIEVAATDGAAAVPAFADGESGAILRDVPTEFAVAARLLNVSGLKLTQAAGQMSAELHTKPLADGSVQRPLLDATFDTAGDAIAAPAHVTARLAQLPNDITVVSGSDRTTYAASSPISSVRLHADNLPGSALLGKVHNVEAFLEHVPASFTLEHNAIAQGVQSAATDPFLRIEVEAWDDGPRATAIDPRLDKVILNTRDGRLHAQVMVHGLTKFVTRKAGLADTVETAWGTQRDRLDVVYVGGSTADPVNANASITKPPRSGTLRVDTSAGYHVTWDASADAALAGGLTSDDLRVNLGMSLPAHTEFCFGGANECNPVTQLVFVDDAFRELVPNDITAFSKASAPIQLDAFVGTDEKNVHLNRLQLQNSRFEISHGPAAGKSNVVKIYADTDRIGIGAAGSSPQGEILVSDADDSSDFINTFIKAGQPLRTHVQTSPFLTVWDMTGIPNRTDEPRRGDLDCGGLTINIAVPEFVGGADGVLDLAGLLRQFNECA